MSNFCHYCPSVPATHSCVVVDMENSGLHQQLIRYKRVPICLAHALQMRKDGCRRVEEIETPLRFYDPCQVCDPFGYAECQGHALPEEQG